MTVATFCADLRAACAEHGPDAPFFTTPVEQRDAYTQEPVPDAAPLRLTDAVIEHGYDATTPGPIGAAKTALVLYADDQGVRFGTLAAKDGTPDLHRREQIAMYTRLKREREQHRSTE